MGRTREFLELVEQQRDHQCTPGRKSTRDRGLGSYSYTFGMSFWLNRWLVQNLRSQQLTNYADFGCGNGVALREAMLIAENEGVPSTLRAIGIDALPVDPQYKFRESLAKLEPTILADDIETIRLTDAPDLITMAFVLMWTHDPLKALANAASQLSPAGFLGASHLSSVYIDREPLVSRQLPGFGIVNRKPLRDGYVLRKGKSAQARSTDEQLTDWFGKVPILSHRIMRQDKIGFNCLYTLK